MRVWLTLLLAGQGWLSSPALTASTAPAEAMVTVAQKGRSDWVIASPPPGSPATGFAARELQKYIQRITGAKLPIVPRTRSKAAIVVGLRNELTPADRGLLPSPAQGHDGYAIAVAPAAHKLPDRIVIGAASGRGALYGAYDLLERFGCRWFYPALDPADPECVPRKRSLALAPGAWSSASPMKHRICNASEWFLEMNAVPAAQQLDWAMKARYNGMGWPADAQTPLGEPYATLEKAGLIAELEKREMLLHGTAHSFNPASDGATPCQCYTYGLSEPWVLAPLTRAIASDRRYFHTNKVDSVHVIMRPRGGWWSQGLNAYLAGRCFYDVSLEPGAVLRDYALEYYGPKAGPLLARYFDQWARDPELGCRARGDSRDADRATLAEQERLWLAPAEALARDNPVFAPRVAKVKKLHTLAQRLTDLHRLRSEIKAARRQGNFDAASQLLAKARESAEATLHWFSTLARLDQGLIDEKEAPTFITAQARNWIDEEAKAIKAASRD